MIEPVLWILPSREEHELMATQTRQSSDVLNELRGLSVDDDDDDEEEIITKTSSRIHLIIWSGLDNTSPPS